MLHIYKTRYSVAVLNQRSWIHQQVMMNTGWHNMNCEKYLLVRNLIVSFQNMNSRNVGKVVQIGAAFNRMESKCHWVIRTERKPRWKNVFLYNPKNLVIFSFSQQYRTTMIIYYTMQYIELTVRCGFQRKRCSGWNDSRMNTTIQSKGLMAIDVSSPSGTSHNFQKFASDARHSSVGFACDPFPCAR